jgi:hypothetical protein
MVPEVSVQTHSEVDPGAGLFYAIPPGVDVD